MNGDVSKKDTVVKPGDLSRKIAVSGFSSGLEFTEKITMECSVVYWGLTYLSRALRPTRTERILEILKPLYEQIYLRVSDRDGMIDRFGYDEVAAWFPRVYSSKDKLTVDRAMDSATEVMHWFYSQYKGSPLLKGVGGGMDLNVGIDAGPVAMVHLRSPYQNEIVLMGTTVTMASNIQKAAGPGEMRIGSEAARASNYYRMYQDYIPTNQHTGFVAVEFDWREYADKSSWIQTD